MSIIQRFREWRKKRAGTVVRKIGNYSIYKRNKKGFTYGMWPLRMAKLNRRGFTEFNVIDERTGRVVGRSALMNEGKNAGMPLGLATLPKHRKQGLGRAQVQEILNELKARGIKRISVPIGPGKYKIMSLSDNVQKTMDFYQKIARKAGQEIKFIRKRGKVYLEYEIK